MDKHRANGTNNPMKGKAKVAAKKTIESSKLAAGGKLGNSPATVRAVISENKSPIRGSAKPRTR